MKIRMKRVYETPESSDGVRILVERLWPRGLSKERASVDHWVRDVAPSPALRKWYQHDPAKWSDFRRRYLAELRSNTDAINELKKIMGRKSVTFVYGSKEEKKNSATVLKAFLEKGGG